MSWSYSGDPASSDKDLVRFLLRDTLSTDQLLSDEEVNYLVATWVDPYEAARNGALTLMAKFVRQADLSRSVGDLSISESFGGRAAEYQALAESIAEQRNRLAPAAPWVSPGNLQQTDVRPDLKQSDFRLGQFDNRRH
jgi:hypothetical protein